MATNLRDDGGYEFKKAIVETVMVFISEIPESRELAIACLCEFIEDCEFAELAVRILHMLGREGPNTNNPTRCIRYIYNRVILENAVVRAAAVAALAKFGVALDALRPSIIVLLRRYARASGWAVGRLSGSSGRAPGPRFWFGLSAAGASTTTTTRCATARPFTCRCWRSRRRWPRTTSRAVRSRATAFLGPSSYWLTARSAAQADCVRCCRDRLLGERA